MVELETTAPTSPPRTVPDSGVVAGRYVLIELLGAGGMGVVWKAYDRVLDRAVALKILHDRWIGARHQQRLVVEARAMARLSHVNVVAVHDVFEHGGRTHLTMELVDGVPASTWLQTAHAWREALQVFRAVAQGVAAAHDAGLVHRDLKPANILIGADGRVRVADFGVASFADPDAVGGDGRGHGGLVGTPAYMAPECLAGGPADARSDQFSFCASFFEALHGRRPFLGANVAALRDAIDRGPPPPIRDVPDWLTAVLARGLARDRTERFPSMHELIAALHRTPRRWSAVVAAAALLGVAAVSLTDARVEGSPIATCQDVAHHLDDAWNEPRRARARAAFGASGLEGAAAVWNDAERELAAHAGRWVAERERTCRAAADGDLDAAEARRQNDCLDGMRRELGMFVESVTATPTPRAAIAARALPDPRACTGGESLELARVLLRRSEARLATGDRDGALADARAAEAILDGR